MLAGLYGRLSGVRSGRRSAACLVARVGLLALVLLAGAWHPPSAGAAKAKRPDLAVGSAAARVADGRLSVAITARNLGRRSAGASTGAVSWKPVAGKGKVVLLKRFPLLAISNGGRRKLTVTVDVPAGASAGRYAVSICLDIRARVRESTGKNNCRSAGTVILPAANVSPVTVVSPAPVPTPSLPGAVPQSTTPPIGGATTPPGGTTPPADTTPPDTRITRGPVDILTNDRTASIWFESTESGSTFSCRLDDAQWSACPPIVNLSGLTDGRHTFEVRAVDPAGNVDPTPDLRTWSVDGTAPQTTISGLPPGPINTTSGLATFGSSEDPAFFQCRMGNQGVWTPCTSPHQVTFPGEGSNTFYVRAYDSSGNIDATPASRTWTVDLTAPDTTLTGGPSGSVATPNATFTLSSTASDKAGFECRLDGGAWAACTSPHQVTGLADGQHTFETRTVDTAGNRDPTPGSRSWTVDATAPDTSILTGPSGTLAATSATFTFTSPEPGATFECRLDGGSWSSCTSPRLLTGLADGSHTFEVRALDALGNLDATPASRSWTVDTTAPDTSITSGPTGVISSASVTFEFSSGDATATFECRVDGGTWSACTSPRQITGLADGSHTFDLRAIDPVGNTDATPASRTWTVDTTPPDTSLSTGPNGTVNSASATFTFTSPEQGATFECRVDAGAWNACTSPRQLAGLADGTHTFEVRALDALGNVDVSPASRTWTVDTTQPDTTITSGPQGTAASSSATFAFSSTATDVVTFECRIDGGAWVTCTSPRQLAGLADGSRTFDVRAIDAAGNIENSPATRTWMVDTTPPDTTITSGPTGAVSTTSTTFAFSSPDPTATFQCRLDAGSWGACVSPQQLTGLSQGSHTFSVRALDPAGNIDASPASRTWTVDTVAPDTSITAGPSGTVVSATANFSFTSPEGGVTFECRLDGGAWAACTSPRQLTGQADGSHTFDVRAVDAAGNADASPATRTWTVDATPPDTSLTSGPAVTVNSTSATFTFSSTDPGATFQCRLDGAAFAPCTSPRQLAGLTEGSHTFEVRASDAAGNIDASPASRTWTVDTTAADTSITGGPTGAVSSTSATFTFSSPDSTATFQCRLDGGAFAACTSPGQLTGLTEGSHTFEVRAVDAAGNIDASPASRTWTVDTTAPDTTITSGPAPTSSSPDATFEFSSADADVASFDCSLDGGAFTTCSSPHNVTGLADGEHTLDVRARDAAGNLDSSPARRTWTIAVVPQA